MTIRFPRAIAFAAIALVGLTAACSDAPTASSARPSAPVHTSGVTVTVGDTTITTFTVDPFSTDTYVEAGVFKLKLQAGSICDPAISTYGATEWDKPCTTLLNTISITARSWTTPSGKTIVKFSPDLRFAPDKVNTLWLWKSAGTVTATPNVMWCASGSTVCVDEASADPSVATTLLSSGFLTRRVKHFSGYASTWGFDGGDSTSTSFGQ
jgi:hypothetical protein